MQKLNFSICLFLAIILQKKIVGGVMISVWSRIRFGKLAALKAGDHSNEIPKN